MTAEQKPAYYTRAQKCPRCQAEVPMSAPRCWLCGHQFLSKEEMEAETAARQKQYASFPANPEKRGFAKTAGLFALTLFLMIVAFGVAAEGRIPGVIVLIAFLVPMSYLWGGSDAGASTFSRIMRGLIITILIIVGLFIAAFIALLIICSGNFH